MDRISIEDLNSVSKAVRVLRSGGVVVYPTETAYGIGADATNPEAVRKVFRIKAREEGKPVPVIVGNIEQAQRHVSFTNEAEILASVYWPGPLTLVLPAVEATLSHVVHSESDIAVRVPGLVWCRELALALGRPITSTSANASGQPPEYSVEGSYKSLGEKAEMVDLWIDGGTLGGGQVSTIVRLTGNVEILREGAVSGEEIKKLLK